MQMNIKELADSTYGPFREALLALEAKVMMLEHDLAEAIEQHEAFKQEVSDAVEEEFVLVDAHTLHRFIIPKTKPDPLVEVLTDTFGASLIDADELRAALEARGLEIREKSKC